MSWQKIMNIKVYVLNPVINAQLFHVNSTFYYSLNHSDRERLHSQSMCLSWETETGIYILRSSWIVLLQYYNICHDLNVKVANKVTQFDVAALIINQCFLIY